MTTTTATKPAKLPREQDPRNPVHRLTALFDAINSATETGGKYTGTLDYTKQLTVEILLPETVKALGEKAKSLPFTALKRKSDTRPMRPITMMNKQTGTPCGSTRSPSAPRGCDD